MQRWRRDGRNKKWVGKPGVPPISIRTGVNLSIGENAWKHSTRWRKSIEFDHLTSVPAIGYRTTLLCEEYFHPSLGKPDNFRNHEQYSTIPKKLNYDFMALKSTPFEFSPCSSHFFLRGYRHCFKKIGKPIVIESFNFVDTKPSFKEA